MSQPNDPHVDEGSASAAIEATIEEGIKTENAQTARTAEREPLVDAPINAKEEVQSTAAASSTTTKPAEEKTSLETVAPRKPSGLPAGASLAERIAALKSSSATRSANGRPGSDRSASVATGSFGGNGANSASVAAVGHEQGRSVSSGPKFGTVGSASAGGVKDRIAKFQTSDRPLLPKSSFGSPAPMHGERNSNALRPYPGATATGGGTGSWGEGVLRPQMTGGTWSGAGEGRGWQSGDLSAPSGIRPQLTGSAWLGAGGGGSSALLNRNRSGDFRQDSTSSTNSTARSPRKQRDAFLDLDEDSSLLSSSPQKLRPSYRRDSSFSEAQLAAAQMGLSRSPRQASNDGTAESVGENTSSVATSREGDTASNVSTLYDLPEAPTQALVNDEKTRVAALPVTPSDAPHARSISTNIIPPSNDVEIGVGNVSPEKMEKLRRSISGSYVKPPSETEGVSNAVRSGLLSEIQARRKDRDSSARSNASGDDGASDIGRLIIGSSATDDGSTAESPLDRERDFSPPTLTQRLENGPVMTATSAGENVMNAESDVAAARADDEHKDDTGNISIPVPIRTSSMLKRLGSNESGVIDPQAAEHSPEQEVNKPLPAASTTQAWAEAQNGGASGLVKSSSEGLNEQQIASANAAQQAKQAITAARSKSQRIQRLPPGRMMTAAEMDASDDEYEPGWASVTTVISSSRHS